MVMHDTACRLITDGEQRLVDHCRACHQARGGNDSSARGGSLSGGTTSDDSARGGPGGSLSGSRLRFATLDWHAEASSAAAAAATAGTAAGDTAAASLTSDETFEVILAVEVLNPACQGEVRRAL